MDPHHLRSALGRLTEFARRYERLFGRPELGRHARVYLRGLLGGAGRKSVEPVALEEGVPVRTLQHFVGQARWRDERVLAEHQRHVSETLGRAHGVLVLDSSGFPKQGRHSVGVARQWCGNLGKEDNCQVGVFLGYASERGHTLLDRRLYLPRAWAQDRERRIEAHVPDVVSFKPGWELAWEMVLEARRRDVPHAWVTGDEEFGKSYPLADQLHAYGQAYVFEVPTTYAVYDEPPRFRKAFKRKTGRPAGKPGVVGLDINTGKEIWRYNSVAPATCSVPSGRCSTGFAAAASAIPGVVFAGGGDGWMHAFEAKTGKIIWEYDTAQQVDTVNGIQGAYGGGDADATLQRIGRQADLTITKTVDKPYPQFTVLPGDAMTYTIVVANATGDTVGNVVVTDNLPDLKAAIYQSDTGGCVVSTPTTLTCNLGDMAALELIQVGSVGYSQLLGLGLAERKVRACNARGVFDDTMAEWNVAMMVNLARDLRGMVRNQEHGVWHRAAPFQQGVRGRVVGLWGYGGVGRETARLAKALGLAVHAMTRRGAGPAAAGFCSVGSGMSFFWGCWHE